MDNFEHNSFYLQVAIYYLGSAQEFMEVYNKYDLPDEEFEDLFGDIVERLDKVAEALEKVRIV